MHNLIIIILLLISIVNIIFMITVLFFERKNPASTWAWLLILAFVPILGFIAYLFLGQDIGKENRFKRKILDDNFKNSSLQDLKKNIIVNEASEHNKDIIRMNYINCKSIYTQNNSVQLFFDGQELFKDIVKELKNAKHFIHLEYYIFRSDSTGAPILDILCEKAKAGVKVRLLVDGMGNKISKEYEKKLKESGVKFEEFFPNLFGIFNIRVNYRNHRKFILIDGHYGYLGGFNVGKEYEGKGPLGYWRDTHLKIVGEALNEIEERFILDWTYCTKQDITSSMAEYFSDYKEADLGHKIPAQIISSGPDHENEHIKNTYMKIINNAKKTLYIQSPYFVPDLAILDSLKLAALSGVEVNIMLPGIPDKFFIPWVANRYIEMLLEYGINIYLYEKGFLHAKTVVSDSIIASVGTANMDIRSFALNFETNAIMYSSKIATELETKFKDDLQYCKKVEKKEFLKRSKKIKFMESIFGLLSPLM